MQRTKFTEKDSKLSALSLLFRRAQLLNQFGQHYSGERDVYKALGYITTLTYDDYYTKYERHDIAKAIINRPAQATWRGGVTLSVGKRDDETSFESTWRELWDRLKLKSAFTRLDKLANIGRYGVLLIGFDDVQTPDTWKTPVRKNVGIRYVKPLGEGAARIASFDQSPSSFRYGFPEFYDISFLNNDTHTATFTAHHSRIIHVPGELLESEIYGAPILEVVFNRLMDLEKLVGASAEMFWRGARPGYTGKVDADHFISDPAREDLVSQLDEYENDLRRFLINEGVTIQALETQVADPSNHVDVQLQMISAVTGIPKRILVGSERGELASSEDKSSWLELIQARQKDFCELQILQPFIDRCIAQNVLPAPEEKITYIWPDLFSPSLKERAEIGKIRAQAIQMYMNNPAAEVICPPRIFYEFMLGLTDEEVRYVLDIYNSDVATDLEKIKAVLAGGDALSGRPPAPPKSAKEGKDAVDD